MKEVNRKFQYWIPIEWVQLTNNKLVEEKIGRIMDSFDMSLVQAIPGRFEWANIPKYAGEYSFIITDGNHRVSAMLQLGIRYIPIIILTRWEYLQIAYDKKHINFIVERSNQIIPEKALSLFIQGGLPTDQRLDRFFTFENIAIANYEKPGKFGHTRKEKKDSEA